MNQSPSPESGRRGEPTLDALGLTTDNPQQRKLWAEGLREWGGRFIAYAQLSPRSLHSRDVLDDFAERFVDHYDTLDDAIRAPLGDLESGDALADFEQSHGLERGTVSWDYQALELFMRSGYDVVERESGVYLFEKGTESTDPEIVATLNLSTSDPELRARWEEGVECWGAAFLAFSTLGLPEFHTTDVLTAFEDLYIASFDNIEDAAKMQIEANGWKDALMAFQAQQSIGVELLMWDYEAIYQQLTLVYEFVWFKGKVHAFAK